MKPLRLQRAPTVALLVRGITTRFTRRNNNEDNNSDTSSVHSADRSNDFYCDNSMLLDQEWSKSMTLNTSNLMTEQVDAREELHMSLRPDDHED